MSKPQRAWQVLCRAPQGRTLHTPQILAASLMSFKIALFSHGAWLGGSIPPQRLTYGVIPPEILSSPPLNFSSALHFIKLGKASYIMPMMKSMCADALVSLHILSCAFICANIIRNTLWIINNTLCPGLLCLCVIHRWSSCSCFVYILSCELFVQIL